MLASTDTIQLGLLGARGFVGRELIGLLEHHPTIALSKAWSERLAGEKVCDHAPGAPAELSFDALDDAPDIDGLDALVVALPNGAAATLMERHSNFDGVVVDLSADHRFDTQWVYGLPEANRAVITGASRIANPGCYATAMGLCLYPLAEHLIGTPTCFGVSGFSGAGATPNERNDPARLAENILPYAKLGHIHERECSRVLGRSIRFAPSVAPFERGIVMTSLFETNGLSRETLTSVYEDAYGNEPLVEVIGEATPLIGDVRSTPRAIIGGIEADGTRGGVVCVIDNLLKGAASQALQNLNLALGQPELLGVSE
jgi:N-acetyl-gamma-glutamyl-phosphate reductase